MNLEKFTDRAKGFLQAAQTVAIRLSHQRITAGHILKALLDDDQGMAAGLIQKAGGNPKLVVAELDAALAVLSGFDEGTDLVLFYKYLMVLTGNPEYSLHFNPSDTLSDSQKHLAATQLKLFQTWYAAWSAQTPRP